MKHFNLQNSLFTLLLVLFVTVFSQNIRAQNSPLALDGNFTAGVSGGAENVKAIAVGQDGSILVGGNFQSANGAANFF